MVDDSVNQARHSAFACLIGLFEPGNCIDLGAGHGAFAQKAADLGWSVTAVDARTDRYPQDERVTWVQADVRDVDLSSYNLIVCLGLFYHLTLDDQLRLLSKSSGRPIILDTHVDHGTHTHRLSDRVTIGDYEGRLYREGNSLTSGWRNAESFWPTLDSFHRMLAANGFASLTLEPWILGDRTFFLAIPAGLGSEH